MYGLSKTMSELLFIAPITKTNIKKPTRRGIPRVSFTRPAVAAEVDPIVKPECAPKAIETRASLQIGTIVIIVGGEKQGKRAVVVERLENGMVKVAGPDFPVIEISQDYLIATSTKLDVKEGATDAMVKAAAEKVPEMMEYLKAEFKVKKSDRIHLMKF